MQMKNLTCCISAVMAMSLAGCEVDINKANATIEAVNQAKTFEEVDFDVKADKKVNKNNIKYSWDFGDGTSSTEQDPKHQYGKPGTYHVSLRLTYKDIKTIKTLKKDIKITGKKAIQTNAVLVKVINTSNEAIKDATVEIDGEVLTTNDRGYITFDKVNANDKVIVSVRAKNYIKQSVQLEANNSEESRTIELKLKEKAVNSVIDNISNSNTYKQDMVSISYDANSFMTADGKEVTGKAKLSVTAWDPTSNTDMSAFLGDGVGIDTENNYAQLQSYGSMTVEFSQNGKPLQLKPGKYATISMPLSLNAHYDGKQLAVGDTIPMWYFSDSLGAWVEDGIGEIYAENNELMLKATVSHFTTWNWDMKVSDPASLFVKCQLSNGRPVPCNTKAEFKYPNSGILGTRQSSIDSQGATIVNIDSNLKEIKFTGRYYDKETGILYTGTQVVDPNTGSLTLVLNNSENLDNETPDFIELSCQLKDGTQQSCKGSALIEYFDLVTGYSGRKVVEFENVAGGLYRLDLEKNQKVTNIQFKAYQTKNGNLKYYGEKEITRKSGIANQVSIVLEEVNQADHLDISCHVDSTVKACTGEIYIQYFDVVEGRQSSYREEFKTDANKPYRLEFGKNIKIFNINIQAGILLDGKLQYIGGKDLNRFDSSQVKVPLKELKSVDHFDISCELPDGTQKACSGQVNVWNIFSRPRLDIPTEYSPIRVDDTPRGERPISDGPIAIDISNKYLSFKTDGYTPYKLSLDVDEVLTNAYFTATSTDKKYYVRKEISDISGIKDSNIKLVLKDALDNDNPDETTVFCLFFQPGPGGNGYIDEISCKGTATITYRDLQSNNMKTEKVKFSYDKNIYPPNKIKFSMPANTIFSVEFDAITANNTKLHRYFDVAMGIPSYTSLDNCPNDRCPMMERPRW